MANMPQMIVAAAPAKPCTEAWWAIPGSRADFYARAEQERARQERATLADVKKDPAAEATAVLMAVLATAKAEARLRREMGR